MSLESENNSGKLQITNGKFQSSGKFQNNAINDVKQISLSHVINGKIFNFYCQENVKFLCIASKAVI